jgi:UDP-3-O-[3-hydroxymyristoyl] glucosamine N-acyltransferase
VTIGNATVIGKDTIIGNNVSIGEGVVIGKNVIVQNCANIVGFAQIRSGAIVIGTCQ